LTAPRLAGGEPLNATPLLGGDVPLVQDAVAAETPPAPVETEPAEPTPVVQPADEDEDGVVDGDDNCPSVANPGQEDAAGDGIGDACAPPADRDGDGVADDAPDNCPDVANPGQEDADGDGIGDACAPVAPPPPPPPPVSPPPPPEDALGA
jgi:hypothetical protein